MAGSGIIVPDSDPAKRKLNSGLFVSVLWTVVLNREWQIVVRFFFLIEFKGFFRIISDYTYLINIGWIRFRIVPDPELGKFKAGSGSGINHSGSTTLVKSKNIQ